MFMFCINLMLLISELIHFDLENILGLSTLVVPQYPTVIPWYLNKYIISI